MGLFTAERGVAHHLAQVYHEVTGPTPDLSLAGRSQPRHHYCICIEPVFGQMFMGERNIWRSLWHGGIQKWHHSNCHKNTITVTVPLYYTIDDQQDRVVGCCSFHLLATVKDYLQIWSCSGLIYFCGWCQNVGNMNQIGYIMYSWWIPWNFLPWELEGITSPCCLLIGQYPHHMTLCPLVAIVKRCYGIHLLVKWSKYVQGVVT